MSQREVPCEDKTVLSDMNDFKTRIKQLPDKYDQTLNLSDNFGDIIRKVAKSFKDKDIQINQLKEEVYKLRLQLQSRDDPRVKKQGTFSRLLNGFLSVFNRGSENTEETRLSSSSKPTKKVQILNSIHTKASDKFASTLMTELNDFDCLMKNTGERLENNIPLIIVCLNSTRLKPDVELALAKVTYPAKYVVLIVHTGAESNLPAISSSKKLNGFQGNIEFIDIGFDVDYGGIYRCQQNDRALGYLREYINRFS